MIKDRKKKMLQKEILQGGFKNVSPSSGSYHIWASLGHLGKSQKKTEATKAYFGFLGGLEQ